MSFPVKRSREQTLSLSDGKPASVAELEEFISKQESPIQQAWKKLKEQLTAPSPLREFLEKLAAQGVEIYLVGGAVRDTFLGRASTDLDFVLRFPNLSGGLPAVEEFFARLTPSSPQISSAETAVSPRAQVSARFPTGVLIRLSAHFPVYQFRDSQGQTYDFALPREERKTKGNQGDRADFEITPNPQLPIERDLSRRDFTINACALRLQLSAEEIQLELIDPYGGLKDLQERTLRAVGDPNARLQEDWSRIMRALRLAAQLELELDPALKEAIIRLAPQINTRDPQKGNYILPREMIGKELTKGYLKNPLLFLRLAHETAVWPNLITPFLDSAEERTALFQQSSLILQEWEKRQDPSPDPAPILASIFLGTGAATAPAAQQKRAQVLWQRAKETLFNRTHLTPRQKETVKKVMQRIEVLLRAYPTAVAALSKPLQSPLSYGKMVAILATGYWDDFLTILKVLAATNPHLAIQEENIELGNLYRHRARGIKKLAQLYIKSTDLEKNCPDLYKERRKRSICLQQGRTFFAGRILQELEKGLSFEQINYSQLARETWNFLRQNISRRG